VTVAPPAAVAPVVPALAARLAAPKETLRHGVRSVFRANLWSCTWHLLTNSRVPPNK
jgi:hypothetical protein